MSYLLHTGTEHPEVAVVDFLAEGRLLVLLRLVTVLRFISCLLRADQCAESIF